MAALAEQETLSPKLIKFSSEMRDWASVVTDEYGTFDVSMIDVGSDFDDADRCQPSLNLIERVCSRCSEACLFVRLLLSAPFKRMTYKMLLFHAANFVFSVIAVVCVLALYVGKLPLSLVAVCGVQLRRTKTWALRHLLQLDCALLNVISPRGEHVMVYSPSVRAEGLNGLYTQLYFGGVKLLATGIPGALAALMFVWSLQNVVATAICSEPEPETNSMHGHALSASHTFDMTVFAAVAAIYACVLLLYVFAFISQQLTMFFCSQYLMYGVPSHLDMVSTADLFSRVLRGAEFETPSDSSSSSGGSAPPIGGFLVCLNVPSATELGVDYEVFRTGPKFQGVKFLPLGLHFVLFRSREQEHGIRQGFFVNVERHAQVFVREWSIEKEELGPPRPGLNTENLERAVLSFQLDSGLGPYPKQHLKTWHRLSSFISASVLQQCGVEYGAILLPGDAIEDASISSKVQTGIIPYFPDLPRTARFTALQKTRTDLSGAARTVYHFDRSERLEELIETQFGGDWKRLLGELQLSFLVFLQLSSLAALQQWKQFIALLCSCERTLSSHVPLFLAFIRLFVTQLEQIPEDFFQEKTARENFLSPCLLSLLELIEDAEAPPPLCQKAFQLRRLLATRFHWDFKAELEQDEFAPVVMTEEELSGAASARTDESFSSSRQSAALSTAQERHRLREEEEHTNAAIAAAFLGKPL